MQQRYKSKKANLGKPLENLIDSSNRQYQLKSLAFVNKLPTPTKQIGKISPKGHFKAVYTKGELVDYVGITVRGDAIAFDAKMTKGKSFPLANLPDHQYKFLLHYAVFGGKGFLIVRFDETGDIYRLDIMIVNRYVEAAKKGGRKSIPLSEFEENGVLIKAGRGISLDYLKGIL